MPVDSNRAQALLLAAFQLSDPAARAALLDRECPADPELRTRVEALLAAHDDSAGLPAPLVDDRTGAFVPPTSELAVGTLFANRYKVREMLGEGGMGTVYVADQTQPVQRRVALKVIKADVSTARLLARFEQERQALALMDHPNIAKVLDAGVAGTTPYFVMELIKGVPITKYCDEAKLTPRQRLELFVPVCQAVQHAHQKGIIHRDLKPSNILVGLYDSRPVPKVIDFGVAKATASKLTDQSVYTEVGALIGTLEYMSPEQAELNNLDIDTRSDIYALGVVLYELLTGSVPLSRKELKAVGFAEMLRIIKEVEPQKPSTRLSGSGSLPSLAASRHTEPKKLAKLFRGELDWMVMKALEKDRSCRYETANGFALDIQRYLADEPVLAGPPSATYRMKKFVKRNKAQVVAASLVLLALISGIGGTTWGLVRADSRRVEAEAARASEAEQRGVAETKHQEAEAARVKADASALAEAEQRKKAEKAEADTLADYRASTDDAIEQLIGSKPELGPKEKTYLENTLKRWQAFANRQGDDERSRAIRGEGHYRVAMLWGKLGRKEESRVEFRSARDIFKNLVEQFSAVPTYRQELAGTHSNLGNLLDDLGKREEARVEYQAAGEIQKKLVEQFPAVPAYQHDLANTHDNLGILLAGLGKREEARLEYQTAGEIQKKLVEQFPTVPAYQQDLASTHNHLGALLARDLGMGDEARAEYQTARVIFKKLVEQFPAVPAYQQDLARTHNNLGVLLDVLGKRDEARAEHQAARDLRKKLVEQFPAMPEYQQELAVTHNNLGVVLTSLGKREEARAEYAAARDVRKKLVDQFPAVPEYQIQLGGSFCNYGILIRDEGKAAASLEWFDLAIRALKPVHDTEPRDTWAKEFLRNSHLGRAQAYDQLQKSAEAVKDWDRAIEISPPAEQPAVRASRATSRLQAGMIAEAVAEVVELTAPVANTPGSPKWTAGQWYDFACTYAVASGKIATHKQEYSDRAMEMLQKAVKAGYKNAAHMAKDTDLDPLRGREDFKKLVAELEKKAAAKTEKQP